LRTLLRTGLLLTVLGLLAAGCGQDQAPTEPTSTAADVPVGMSLVAAMETIDFEGLPAGTIVDEVYGDLGSGPVAVSGNNPVLGAVNAAVIFDSSNPTGEDPDLGTPNEDFGGPGIGLGGEAGAEYQNDTSQGNLLILAEDLVDGNGDDLVDDPDDADVVGEVLSFDFSAVGTGTVTIHSITLIDVEAVEAPAVVRFYDAGDVEIGSVDLPAVGDNGLAVVDLGDQTGVVRMGVTLNGSGAIDDIVFTPDEEPELGSIGDYVWCDDNNDGFQDPGEPGIPGVEVTLTCAGEDGDLDTGDDIVATTTTDAAGMYLFTGIPAGLCRVEVDMETAGDVLPGLCPTSLEVDLGEGEDYLDADFCFVCDVPEEGDEGCTPGYWKNHPEAWDYTGYSPDDLVKDVWSEAEACVGDLTLLEALDGGGGPSFCDKVEILLRAATASLLNASSTEVDFTLSVSEIVDGGNEAIASGDKYTVLALASDLDYLNNSGCPLGRYGTRNDDKDEDGDGPSLRMGQLR
jgi:hypothetical protein